MDTNNFSWAGGWVEGGTYVVAGHPLAPVSEADVGNGMPESPVPCLRVSSPAWEGDPGGKANLAHICHSDTLIPAADCLSPALHHNLS